MKTEQTFEFIRDKTIEKLEKENRLYSIEPSLHLTVRVLESETVKTLLGYRTENVIVVEFVPHSSKPTVVVHREKEFKWAEKIGKSLGYKIIQKNWKVKNDI